MSVESHISCEDWTHGHVQTWCWCENAHKLYGLRWLGYFACHPVESMQWQTCICIIRSKLFNLFYAHLGWGFMCTDIFRPFQMPRCGFVYPSKLLTPVRVQTLWAAVKMGALRHLWNLKCDLSLGVCVCRGCRSFKWYWCATICADADATVRMPMAVAECVSWPQPVCIKWCAIKFHFSFVSSDTLTPSLLEKNDHDLTARGLDHEVLCLLLRLGRVPWISAAF